MSVNILLNTEQTYCEPAAALPQGSAKVPLQPFSKWPHKDFLRTMLISICLQF